MSNQAILSKLQKLEKAFTSGECPLINYNRSRDGSLFWITLPEHIRDAVMEHQRVLNSIRLKPGDWKPRAYEFLSEEERTVLHTAWEIMGRCEIKEGE